MFPKPSKFKHLLVFFCFLHFFSSPLGADEVLWKAESSGKELYEKLCADCHGQAGQPSADAAQLFGSSISVLSDPSSYHGDADLRSIEEVVRQGSGNAMLPFGNRISDSQIAAISEFVFSLRKSP